MVLKKFIGSELVGDTYKDYARFIDLQTIIEKLSTERLSQQQIIKGDYTYVKTSTEVMWYLLATILKLRGKTRFNKTVGLRYWDIGLVMVDTPSLTNEELPKALNIAKQLLIARGVELNKPDCMQQFVVRSVLYDVLMANDAMATNITHNQKTPEWPDVTENMDISKWL